MEAMGPPRRSGLASETRQFYQTRFPSFASGVAVTWCRRHWNGSESLKANLVPSLPRANSVCYRLGGEEGMGHYGGRFKVIESTQGISPHFPLR